MNPYLPAPGEVFGDLAAVASSWGVGALLLLAGRGLVSTAPEIAILCGWGALSLWLTLWGVFSPFALYAPLFAFVLAALLFPAFRGRRPGRGAVKALLRMLALSLPLWLVMAPIRPSQPDSFLNLLPNAFYLVDYGRFPAAGLPPSFSYLPGAPYNTQFLSFLGSLLKRGYPVSGMSLVNVMLTLLAGLAIARALARKPGSADKPPSWTLTATGFLLATLFNPGFVPRVNFASYGETALAATALVSAILVIESEGDLAVGRMPRALSPLALVLAAMINAKQSGVGLVVALLLAALLTGLAEGAARRRALFGFLAAAALPAAVLYAVWRYHMAGAGVAELRPLPFALWNWREIPQALSSALWAAWARAWYFAAVALAFGLVPVFLRRQGWTATTRLLVFFAALFILYNGFVFFTYVAVFAPVMSAAAHSFFRYNAQLSLVLVLALALALRDLGLFARLGKARLRVLGAGTLALALLAPIGFAKSLRFDLVMPQPLVWDLAKDIAPYLGKKDRLALILPGDNGSLEAMLSGLLRFEPPRHPRLRIFYRAKADRESLALAARRGVRLLFLSCTGKGLLGLAPQEAALLSRHGSSWRPLASWPYPAGARKRRWQRIISWRPLCRPR